MLIYIFSNKGAKEREYLREEVFLEKILEKYLLEAFSLKGGTGVERGGHLYFTRIRKIKEAEF